jgi:hypothetical protein
MRRGYAKIVARRRPLPNAGDGRQYCWQQTQALEQLAAKTEEARTQNGRINQ